MKTTLGVTLTALTLLGAVESGRRRSWALAGGVGFVAGLASLVRENFLLFALALAAFRLVQRRPAEGAAVAAGLALAILPATLHNFSYDGEFLPITSQAGQNFYTGLHPGNNDGGYLVPDFVPAVTALRGDRLRGRGGTSRGRRSDAGRDLRVLAERGPARPRRRSGARAPPRLREVGAAFPRLRDPGRRGPALLPAVCADAALAVARLRGVPGAGYARTRPRGVPPACPAGVAAVLSGLRYVGGDVLRVLALPAAARAGARAVRGLRSTRSGSRRSGARCPAGGVGGTGGALRRADGLSPLPTCRRWRTPTCRPGSPWRSPGNRPRRTASTSSGWALEPDHPKLLRRAAILAWDAAVAAGTTRPDSTLVDLVTRAFEANSTDTSLLARYGAALAGQGKLEGSGGVLRSARAGGRGAGWHLSQPGADLRGAGRSRSWR